MDESYAIRRYEQAAARCCRCGGSSRPGSCRPGRWPGRRSCACGREAP